MTTAPKTKIKFVHHPRTGGTYLAQVATHNKLTFPKSHFFEITPGRDEFLYMTTLRRPVDRVVSYLRYFWYRQKRRRDWYKEACGEVAGRQVFLESSWRDFDWVKSTNSMEVHNAMCCRLADHQSFGPSTYEVAISNLDLFDKVCVFENYPSVIDGLSELCGHEIQIPSSINKNASRNIDYQFTGDDLSWIAENNQADQSLYDYVVKNPRYRVVQ